jgi:two-component system sensor histidine kinase KdpD
VVRSAARLAGQLGTEWHAVYVETPALQRLPAAERERILKTLKMAQDLGATTAVLSGNSIAATAVDYARSHNLSRITMGRGHLTWPWRRSHIRSLAHLAPDIDLIEVSVAERDEGPRAAAGSGAWPGAGSSGRDEADEADASRARSRAIGYGMGAAASIGMALLATPLLAYLDLANIAMLFLLVVLLVAVRYGRGPSVLATCVSVACFDYFFVAPRFSFAISDLQYAITFGVMLAVGLITAQLTAGLRFQARVAAHRESRARALYEFARELSGALQTEQIFETTARFVQSTFRARATLLMPDNDGRLHLPPGAAPPPGLDEGVAQWAFDHAESAGMGTDTLPASALYYMPLVAPMRTRGVLAIEPVQRRWIFVPEQRQHLDTFAALAAIALERVHYIEVAQEALVSMESERLRNSLLAALSHDLRTPLTSLVGLSESLAGSKPPLAPAQLDLARSLHDESLRMSALVANLLDMARIESGELRFNLQWQPLEEVVGSALRCSALQLKQHKVGTQLPHDLPLLRFDAVLIERVLCNLLENAGKYTPPGSSIVIHAVQRGEFVRVMVYDNGPGLPRGREEAIFEKFTRGERESAKPGVGLGLAICRAIVEAHGGTIEAAKSPIGGAAFVFTLPVGTPPEMPDLHEPPPERMENEL